jgi:hypothetical protein
MHVSDVYNHATRRAHPTSAHMRQGSDDAAVLANAKIKKGAF